MLLSCCLETEQGHCPLAIRAPTQIKQLEGHKIPPNPSVEGVRASFLGWEGEMSHLFSALATGFTQQVLNDQFISIKYNTQTFIGIAF